MSVLGGVGRSSGFLLCFSCDRGGPGFGGSRAQFPLFGEPCLRARRLSLVVNSLRKVLPNRSRSCLFEHIQKSIGIFVHNQKLPSLADVDHNRLISAIAYKLGVAPAFTG
jgi:hypothetical protein